MSSGSHPWTSQTLATGLLPFLPGWALRRVWPGRSGAAEVARATFTFAFDGTHGPPKAAGANLQLLCRLLDLGVSSLAPSSASASLQLPEPGVHRVGAALFRAGRPAAGCIVLCTMGWHALQHGPIIGAKGREAWRLMNEFVISAFPPRGAACPRGP